MATAGGTTKIKITNLNPHLACVLCGGYYIDATTIIECLHSFCKTCIVRYLETSKYCPICDVQVHKTRPYLNIRPDQTLQDLVYKLVPGLFTNEMRKRREFYAKHPIAGSSTGEATGDVTERDRLIYSEDEKISLSLEFSPDGKPVLDEDEKAVKDEKTASLSNKAESQPKSQQAGSDTYTPSRRFLLCPAAFSIGLLKKFIRVKFGLGPGYEIDIFHVDEPLCEQYTLMDIAYIYTWRRLGPLRLFYTIYESQSLQQSSASQRVVGSDRAASLLTQTGVSDSHRPTAASTHPPSLPPPPQPTAIKTTTPANISGKTSTTVAGRPSNTPRAVLTSPLLGQHTRNISVSTHKSSATNTSSSQTKSSLGSGPKSPLVLTGATVAKSGIVVKKPVNIKVTIPSESDLAKLKVKSKTASSNIGVNTGAESLSGGLKQSHPNSPRYKTDLQRQHLPQKLTIRQTITGSDVKSPTGQQQILIGRQSTSTSTNTQPSTSPKSPSKSPHKTSPPNQQRNPQSSHKGMTSPQKVGTSPQKGVTSRPSQTSIGTQVTIRSSHKAHKDAVHHSSPSRPLQPIKAKPSAATGGTLSGLGTSTNVNKGGEGEIGRHMPQTTTLLQSTRTYAAHRHQTASLPVATAHVQAGSHGNQQQQQTAGTPAGTKTLLSVSPGRHLAAQPVTTLLQPPVGHGSHKTAAAAMAKSPNGSKTPPPSSPLRGGGATVASRAPGGFLHQLSPQKQLPQNKVQATAVLPQQQQQQGVKRTHSSSVSKSHHSTEQIGSSPPAKQICVRDSHHQNPQPQTKAAQQSSAAPQQQVIIRQRPALLSSSTSSKANKTYQHPHHGHHQQQHHRRDSSTQAAHHQQRKSASSSNVMKSGSAMTANVSSGRNQHHNTALPQMAGDEQQPAKHPAAAQKQQQSPRQQHSGQGSGRQSASSGRRSTAQPSATTQPGGSATSGRETALTAATSARTATGPGTPTNTNPVLNTGDSGGVGGETQPQQQQQQQQQLQQQQEAGFSPTKQQAAGQTGFSPAATTYHRQLSQNAAGSKPTDLSAAGPNNSNNNGSNTPLSPAVSPPQGAPLYPQYSGARNAIMTVNNDNNPQQNSSRHNELSTTGGADSSSETVNQHSATGSGNSSSGSGNSVDMTTQTQEEHPGTVDHTSHPVTLEHEQAEQDRPLDLHRRKTSDVNH